MNKKSMWSLKFNTASLVLIPAAIGINYLGKLFAELLNLPLWLDSIGTCLAAVLGGPIIGAICGAANNIIYGITMGPTSLIYALTSAGIGIVVGIFAYKGKCDSLLKAIVTGIAAGLVATVISTPLNIMFWGGTTGKILGDAVFSWAIANGSPVFIASAIDEILGDVPDKIVTLIIVFGIYKGLPKTLTSLYKNGEDIEHLD